MLRTQIVTADESTGAELPIPPDLLAKVERADAILRDMLRKVSTGFEIEARWQFRRLGTTDPVVELTLVSLETPPTEVTSVMYPFSPRALDNEEAIKRNLWEALGLFIPLLSEVVDRLSDRIRRTSEALVATGD